MGRGYRAGQLKGGPNAQPGTAWNHEFTRRVAQQVSLSDDPATKEITRAHLEALDTAIGAEGAILAVGRLQDALNDAMRAHSWEDAEHLAARRVRGALRRAMKGYGWDIG